MAVTRTCVICGAMIEAERQELLPETQLCFKHAREIERFGGELTVTVENVRSRQTGSIGPPPKVAKERNHEALAKLRAEFERGGA